MSLNYCPHCGTQVGSGSKFCPSCGKPLISAQAQAEKLKLYKGQSKSLADQDESLIKSTISREVESVKKEILKPQSVHPQSPPVNQKPEPASPKPTEVEQKAPAVAAPSNSAMNPYLLVLVALSVVLVFLNFGSQFLLGAAALSLVAGLLMYLRRNKPNPVNWMVKVVLVVHLLLFLAVMIQSFPFYSGLVKILMILVVILDMVLIFKKAPQN